MALSEQDREWVKAMIQEAASESLNASRNFTRGMVDGHAKDCPNIKRLCWLAAGLGIGLGASAPAIVKGVIALFAA